jgi:hypothetical protein
LGRPSLSLKREGWGEGPSLRSRCPSRRLSPGLSNLGGLGAGKRFGMVKRVVLGVLAAVVVPIAALAAYVGLFGFGAVINDGVPVQGASAAEASVTPVTVARGLGLR